MPDNNYVWCPKIEGQKDIKASTKIKQEVEMGSRRKTEEEVRQEMLSQIQSIVKYWAELPGKTDFEKCNGVALSILSIFDGTTMALPAMDISLAPHFEDKQFDIDRDENWYEPGMVINDTMLHEIYAANKAP